MGRPDFLVSERKDADGNLSTHPCPCGYRTDPRRQCRCSPGEVQRYMARLSGPLLDRIDIHVDVPSLSFEELTSTTATGPSSAEIRETVQQARDRQRTRYEGRFQCNAHLDAKAVRQHCALNDGAKALLEAATERLGLSARAYDKLLRVARTIADLENAPEIAETHLAEAIQYRSLDRQIF